MRHWVPVTCRIGRGVQDEVPRFLSLRRINAKVREWQKTPFTQRPTGQGMSSSQHERARLGSIVKYG